MLKLFIESLSVFMNISKEPFLAIFGTFSRISSEITLKDDKTSI